MNYLILNYFHQIGNSTLDENEFINEYQLNNEVV